MYDKLYTVLHFMTIMFTINCVNKELYLTLIQDLYVRIHLVLSIITK